MFLLQLEISLAQTRDH